MRKNRKGIAQRLEENQESVVPQAEAVWRMLWRNVIEGRANWSGIKWNLGCGGRGLPTKVFSK